MCQAAGKGKGVEGGEGGGGGGGGGGAEHMTCTYTCQYMYITLCVCACICTCSTECGWALLCTHLRMTAEVQHWLKLPACGGGGLYLVICLTWIQ